MHVLGPTLISTESETLGGKTSNLCDADLHKFENYFLRGNLG